MKQLLELIIGLKQGIALEDFLIINFFIALKYGIIFSALMTVIVTNPIHAVLYLVLTFVLMAGMIISLGAEFLGILLIIVYVGAIAVLFLFIVMMLNIEDQKKEVDASSLISTLLSVIPVLLLALLASQMIYHPFVIAEQFELRTIYILPFSIQWEEWLNTLQDLSNVTVLGTVLYTYYSYLLVLAGFILLLAMIASISLTLMPLNGSLALHAKHQDKYVQLERKLNKSVILSSWSQK